MAVVHARFFVRFSYMRMLCGCFRALCTADHDEVYVLILQRVILSLNELKMDNKSSTVAQ